MPLTGYAVALIQDDHIWSITPIRIHMRDIRM